MDEQSVKKRKGGGRRALPADQRRSIRREVWLSPSELADLKSRASVLGITPGEYMRRAITQSPMPRPPVPRVNLDAWRELARLAANANQYQRAMNMARGSESAPVRWPDDLIPNLLEAIREVRLGLMGLAPDAADADSDGGEDD
jgi:hypothetical protein